MARQYTVEAGAGYPYDDPYRLFLGKLSQLREIARDAAANKAYSYRQIPVLVGTAALNVVDGTRFWGVTNGYNTKAERKQKHCSELKALDKARLGGFTRAIGMVVVSSTNRQENEGITGFPTPTLLPCGVCQGDFRGHPIARNDTLVVTAHLTEDTIQVNTVGRLAEIIADGESDRLVYDRTLSGLDFDRLVPRYDMLKKDQLYIPEAKRLSGPEMVTFSILSHRAPQV